MATHAIDFDAATHTYKLGGKSVPGVSAVLEPLQKLDDIPPDILAAAAEFGTQVHQAVHLFNVDDLVMDSLAPRVARYLDGYCKFLADSRMQILLTEKRVGSPKYGYCGTLDLWGELQKRRALLDVKATAAYPRIVEPQSAAYAQALQETTGDTTQRRYCLHLRENDYKLTECKNPQDFNVFLSCLNVHRWRNSK